MRVRSLGMMGVAALLCAAAMTVVGCGGRQRPPERGSCREGREWVAPAADSHGVMQDGYCRSTGAT
jgi:hypothetical protein